MASTDQTIHKDPIATYLSNPEEVRAMRPSEQYDFCGPEPVKVEVQAWVQVRLNQAVENARGSHAQSESRSRVTLEDQKTPHGVHRPALLVAYVERYVQRWSLLVTDDRD